MSLTLVARDYDGLQLALPEALEAAAGTGRTIAGHPRSSATGPPTSSSTAVISVTLRRRAASALEALPVDVCVQPAEGRRKRLLVADMDSTIISCECLDELADFAGLQAEIAAITERAMAGEMPFEVAIDERVSRLAGLDLSMLQRTYDERVRLNPGAATLARTMSAAGARCVLVSGGFEFFAQRVAAAAGFHAHRANRLIDDGARLTGEVALPILGRDAKLAALVEEAAALGLDMSETLAVGDGANDLAMIEAAGLGVA